MRRISVKDLLALLLLLLWCGVGAVKTLHDVAEYRAQQAAIEAFHNRYPEADRLFAAEDAGAAVAAAPYDPALGKWLIGEAVGYVLTLVVVAIGSYQAGRRSTATVQVKWIAPTSQAGALRIASPQQRGAPAPSGNVAADRLSVVVWTDRAVQLERERA